MSRLILVIPAAFILDFPILVVDKLLIYSVSAISILVPIALKLQESLSVKPFAITMPVPVLPIAIVTHKPVIIPVNPWAVPVTLVVLAAKAKMVIFVLKIIFASAVFLVIFPPTLVADEPIEVILNPMPAPKTILVHAVILE
jgi:hypothetical protein